jgi:hypothetical protein
MNDLKAMPQTSFKERFESGKGSGRGALLCKGAILNGTIFNKLQVEKDIIYRQISGPSSTHLVHVLR